VQNETFKDLATRVNKLEQERVWFVRLIIGSVTVAVIALVVDMSNV
jgi:hypothetical protein